jgi:hypothetical protein
VTQPATVLPVSHPFARAVPVHVRSCAQVPGPALVPAPHMLFVHVCPLGHVPQLSVPPQPSETLPQVAPACEHVFGVQPEVQAATGFCAGVGQSLYAKPAALVNVAANCAQPLSHFDEQQ